MSTLLHIDSSPLYGRSVSRQLTGAFVDQWKSSHLDGTVIDRDLNATAISPITAEWVGAAYTPEAARTPQQKKLLAVSDALLAELEQADEYVIGVPMHNFGVPSVLKLWIDQIARVGRTFTYGSGIPKGLLSGKKATFIIATGGIYDAQTRMACTVGPNYKRPTIDIPQDYRGRMAPEIAAASSSPSIADERWTSIFGDPVLEGLIREALTNNLDLQIAAQRILEMQAEVGIARSQQLPSLEAGGSVAGVQLPSRLASENGGIINKYFLAGGGPSLSSLWNLDFWGLYRRQTEAARAELLASEWAQKEIRNTIVESVAGAYFDLRGLDDQLAITKKTIAARKESLQLTQALEQHGAGSLADLRQAEELVHTAQANIPVLRRQIAIAENSISVLMGHMPEAIGRGLPIQEQPHPLQVPTGIPSELLERRPDIQEAEAKLIAANARIGVARAQFFPQISLTSAGGVSSNQLSSLLTSGSSYWYAIGSISQPLFEGGRIRSNYRLSQVQKQEMVVRYQKTILDAFRDVSDTLVSYKETREYREEQAADVTAATDAVRLARLRYAGGNASYLEVLTTDTDLYSAQLVLARAEQQEAASLVQLYAGLGGGWQ